MVDKIGKSVVRTIAPLVVGLVVAGLARIHVSTDQQVVTDVVTAGVSAVYYALARVLEEKVSPNWGWLLGAKGAPQYKDATAEKIALAVQKALADYAADKKTATPGVAPSESSSK